ncbi:MAG: F0F1 ATP synthase subunit B [Alphaproteobacteria bacterium]|nr:F0F1 ATP synthase subunit B [Alphaproteobacteria bacterium]
MLNNPTFWVAVGFVIFVVLTWKPLKRAALGQLDAHAAKVRAQIEEAERLRNEAHGLLEDYKRKHKAAIGEAEAIVARAHEEAQRIAAEASAALDAALKRREQQTLDKIAQAEAAALRDVRNQAVEIAIAAARTIVAEQMKGPAGAAALESAIRELPQKLH